MNAIHCMLRALGVPALLGVLMSCASKPPVADVAAPPPVHAYSVAAQQRGQTMAFVTCSDCPRPTPKTLPAPRPTLTASPPVLSPALSPVQKAAPDPRLLSPAIRSEVFSLVFDLNSATLSSRAKGRLDALVALAQQSKRIRIFGYTDDLGSPALNAGLSDRRALAVMLHLRDRLVEPRPELTATGRPQCCYMTDNRDERHRAPNRRVELTVELADTAAVDRLVQAARAQLVGAAPTRQPDSAGQAVPAAGEGEALTLGTTAARATSANNTGGQP